MKFRIVRTDGPTFTFPKERYEVVLRPVGTRARSEPVDSGWRIRVEKAVFTFGFRSEGIDVAVEGLMPPHRVRAVVKEIAENIAAYTEQHCRVQEVLESELD